MEVSGQVYTEARNLWRREQSVALSGIEPRFLCRLARNLVAIATELRHIVTFFQRDIFEKLRWKYEAESRYLNGSRPFKV
jgi:hypothetical protein